MKWANSGTWRKLEQIEWTTLNTCFNDTNEVRKQKKLRDKLANKILTSKQMTPANCPQKCNALAYRSWTAHVVLVSCRKDTICEADNSGAACTCGALYWSICLRVHLNLTWKQCNFELRNKIRSWAELYLHYFWSESIFRCRLQPDVARFDP
jgi:hypothetical protein